MSALVPEVGDRYERDGRLVQVIALEKVRVSQGVHGPGARLRGVLNGRATGSMERPVSLEKLAFDTKWRFLGNYLPVPGYTVHAVGPHWYYRTPAGNVHGAPRGVRWTEADALKAARADAEAERSAASRRAG